MQENVERSHPKNMVLRKSVSQGKLKSQIIHEIASQLHADYTGKAQGRNCPLNLELRKAGLDETGSKNQRCQRLAMHMAKGRMPAHAQ